jgi:hypothetical protein
MNHLDMKHLFLTTIFVSLFFVNGSAAQADESATNLVLVTLDGVRWQEVFAGIDPALVEDERYTENEELLRKHYWHEQRDERRKALFPFLWATVASQGVIIGDRMRDSYMEVTNPWWFSYPGYNEILTGSADPLIDSNSKKWNLNTTFLEVLNGMPEFHDSVMAFGSWDVFPYIINTRRSGVPVNAGFDIVAHAQTQKTIWLNEVSAEAPKLWGNVRVDFLTHGYAMEALKSRHPRVTYISYGETDDFAHDDSYDRYIDAANRTDMMLAKLWNWLQSDPFYRGRTTLIITTDHGRGEMPDGWPYHASAEGAIQLGSDSAGGVPGSDQIWFAAIGPEISAKGLLSGQWKQSQIAATALSSLDLDPLELLPQAGKVMDQVLR